MRSYRRSRPARPGPHDAEASGTPWKILRRWIDRGLDGLIWLHERTLLYICIVLLLPLMLAVVWSLLIADLRPLLRPLISDIARYEAMAWPLWLLASAMIERSSHPLAARYRSLLDTLPVSIGLLLFAVGGLMWWQGSV
jgi:hypothetical protein